MVDWEEFPTDTDTSKDIIILSRFFRSYQGWPDGWLLYKLSIDLVSSVSV